MGDFTAERKSNEQIISERKTARGKKIYNKVFEGGKKPAAKKPAAKKPTYSSKYWDIKRSKNETDMHDRTYLANKKGVVRSTTHSLVHTRNIGGDRVVSLPSKYTSIDTTGYSKGKKEFTIKQKKTDPSDGMGGKKTYNSWTIPRSKVKSTLNTMKKGTGMLQKEAAQKKKTLKKKTTKKK